MNYNLIKKNYLKKTKLLNKYNKFYYDKNNPAVDDQEYDQLKKDVLEIEKNVPSARKELYNKIYSEFDYDVATQLLDSIMAIWFTKHSKSYILQSANLDNYSKYLIGEHEEPPQYYSSLLENAIQKSQEHQFFHWELEFPNVFLIGNGEFKGFDAIVGNPPWGVSLSKNEKLRFDYE